MLTVEVNTVEAIAKFEEYTQKKIDAAQDQVTKDALTEKQKKKLNRINKFRKGAMRVANVANQVCSGADFALKAATTIESTCWNQMDVTIFGFPFGRFLLYDSLCASISFGDDVNTGMKQSWCEDATSPNPNIAGMNQAQYFQTLNSLPEDAHNMAGIAAGTSMCQWHAGEGSGYCSFNEETAKIVHQNKLNKGDCMDFPAMVAEFKGKGSAEGFTFRSESEKVAHFQIHAPGLPLGGFMDCGDVSVTMIPGSFDRIFDSTYGQVANLEEFFHLEVGEVNMGVYDYGKAFAGTAAPRPTGTKPEDCLDLFIINTDIDCPTDWLMGDILISKEYDSTDSSDGYSVGGSGLAAVLGCCLCAAAAGYFYNK
jgi:hypothetical protein